MHGNGSVRRVSCARPGLRSADILVCCIAALSSLREFRKSVRLQQRANVATTFWQGCEDFVCNRKRAILAFAICHFRLRLSPLRYVAVLLVCWAAPAFAWRSTLYPTNWVPPGLSASFETNKLIQDFSYAGYKAGEQALPNVVGPIFDVTQSPYNADKTGATTAPNRAFYPLRIVLGP